MNHFGQGGVNQQGGGGPQLQQGGGGPNQQQGAGNPHQQQGGGGPRNQQGGRGPHIQQGRGGPASSRVTAAPTSSSGGGEGMAHDYARCVAAHQDTVQLLQRLPACAHTFFQPELQQVYATQQHLAHLCSMLLGGSFVPPPAITAVLAASAAPLMAAFCHLGERVCALEEDVRALEEDKQLRERAIYSGIVASQLDYVTCLAVFRGEQYRRGTTIGQLILQAECSERQAAGVCATWQAAGAFAMPQHLDNFKAFNEYLVQQGTNIYDLHQLTQPMRRGRFEVAHLMIAAESVSSSDLMEWADEVGEEQGRDVREALALLALFVPPGATAEQRQLPLRKELTNYVHVSAVVDAAVGGGAAGGSVGGGVLTTS